MAISNAAVTGDPTQWLEHHGDALFRYARSRLADDNHAEDLVQETLLAAWRCRAEFRGESAERTWLIGILRNKLVDHFRKRVRELPLSADEEGDAVVDHLFAAEGHWRRAPNAWREEPGDVLEQSEFVAIFAACREALPKRQAMALTLRLLEGVEADVVCKELAVTPTNLWVLLHRARLRLRECLDAKWFGGQRPVSQEDVP